VIAIRLIFPAGRYHANPWGRHVNEGVAEWPPSPYRLVRALYDVWQRKCYDFDAEDVKAVLQALASSPPRFLLPPTVATHTRSYLSANAVDPSDKNLVFDAFVAFNKSHECYVCWDDVDLSTRHTDILRELLSNLNFLGRSESWVHAEPCADEVHDGIRCDVVDRAENAGDLVPVACPMSAAEYMGNRPWLDELTFSTADMLKQRASSPPLLKQVRYVRPTDAVTTDPVRRFMRRRREVNAVVLSLDATVLPLVTTTIEVAEQIRTRLMGAHRCRMNGDPLRVSPLFSGKTADGQKRLDHGHVYILPLAAESPSPRKQGRIDRILIVSPLRAFTEDELDAVRSVRELWQADGRPTVRSVLTWQGASDEFSGAKGARTVISTTPFVPPRNWRKGRDHERFLIDELRRECANHKIQGSLVEAERLGRLSKDLFDIVEYRRNRKNDPVRRGYAFRLHFSKEVRTPFALGYGAHFGLGQFAAE
jgi:CRISPR-associated protein Csb2